MLMGGTTALAGIDGGCKPAAARRTVYWTTREDAILRAVYPEQGARAAQAQLPGRTLRAVLARALAHGLKSGARAERAPRNHWPQCDRVDDQLRALLPLAAERGGLERIAQSIGRPAWWVYRRSVQLGLAYPRRSRDAWSAQEDDILRAAPALGLRTLQKRLKQAGYTRTEVAIKLRLSRLEIDRWPDGYMRTGDVAQVMGVSLGTVQRWIKAEGLRADRTPDSTAEAPKYRVRATHLRSWIASHALLVDLRRVDRFLFLDLVFNAR